MTRHILVTGATGFLGGHILRALLQNGYRVICAARSRQNIKKLREIGHSGSVVDIQEKEALQNCLECCDVVIHLAGQLGEHGIPYNLFYETNCALTEELLLLSDKCGVKQFIFCSTPGVYGFGQRLCKEDSPYAPRNDYEKTKVIAEQRIMGYCHNASVRYTILRPDFIYGPEDTRRVKMYKYIKNKKFILTTNGKSYLHPTYVEDVTQAFLLCVGNAAAMNQVFNVAAAHDITVKEYLSTIARCTDSKLIHVNMGYVFSAIMASAIDRITQCCFDREGFVSKNKIDFLAMDHSSDIEKAVKTLEYRPQYDFERGFYETVRWCEQNNLFGP